MSKVKKDTKNTKRANVTDIKTLTEMTSQVARLQVKLEDRKIGLRNFGPDLWYWTFDGRQMVLRRNAKVVIDQRTFENGILGRDGFQLGHIIQDQSLLAPNDLPGDDFTRPVNALFDDEIKELIKNDDNAISVIEQLTSIFTINRILAFASKNKRKMSNIIYVCKERLFILQNGLGDDFWELDIRGLRDLAKEKSLPDEFLKPEEDETVDDYRDRIVEYLKVD